jgi:carboxyl-terminal processing protease
MLRIALFVPAVVLCACDDLAGPWPGGIGAVLRFQGTAHTLTVEDVPPESASAQAGLAVGDEVTAIDGAPVSDMSTEDVVRRLRGPVGSKVRLTIRRHESERVVEIEREPYRRPP